MHFSCEIATLLKMTWWFELHWPVNLLLLRHVAQFAIEQLLRLGSRASTQLLVYTTGISWRSQRLVAAASANHGLHVADLILTGELRL